MKPLTSVLLVCFAATLSAGQVKPVKTSVIRSSGFYNNYKPELCIDGVINDNSRWVGKPDSSGAMWIELKLEKKQKLAGVHIYSGYKNTDAVSDLHIEYRNTAGEWQKIPSATVVNNLKTVIPLEFDNTVEVDADALRIVVTKSKGDLARLKEVFVWPATGGKIPQMQALDGEGAGSPEVPLIYLNQSGFNTGAPKRFTAPTLPDGTPFSVVSRKSAQVMFKGVIQNHVGDFSAFNSDSGDEYMIQAADVCSFPFRAGHWWLERVTYQNAVDFMVESRHYFGNYRKACQGSFGWRDDHHFGWELNTLVPQYLSNPAAYERMPHKISYESLPGQIGALKPYDESAPDIVKLIHFGADIIVTRRLDHELLKEQLAFFLYAWPCLKQWLPEQNYRAVSDYAFACWETETVAHRYPYDRSRGHNVLALKTAIGTTKGELPPGHTVLPNLLMYETARRDKRVDSEKFFQAAFNQVEWMIANLDWNDPLVTKGQRMSEHVTMTGLALMLKEYPQRAPRGLKEKIEQWQQVMIRRSANMWDFRKLSDSQWVPTGEKITMWNEPGNVLGFPAALLASMQVTPDSRFNQRLTELVYSHLDNAFGRNPTGRHFSYDGPREIEGVDLGWYSYHHGGIGMLADVRFVFDGSPKNEHYPYNPGAGNVGWSEGWVQFNVAYNLSLAYLAYAGTELKVVRDGGKIIVRLKAPLNFDYTQRERATVQILRNGVQEPLRLVEEDADSAWFAAEIPDPSGLTGVSYGYGYFKHSAQM